MRLSIRRLDTLLLWTVLSLYFVRFDADRCRGKDATVSG